MASAAIKTSAGYGPSLQIKHVTNTCHSTSESPHHVHTTFNYYKDPGDGSEPAPSIAGRKETYNQPSVDLEMTVTDITGNEEHYTLDGQGFQFCYHVSKEKHFLDDAKIEAEHYPEVEKLLKDITGASRIFIFDHTIRRPNPDGDPTTRRNPVKRVHIDQSNRGAENQVLRHLGLDAPRLLASRYQIINVWRPIKPILKDPLAVCDSHSVPDADIVPVKLIFSDRVGEPCTVLPNRQHRWYYRYGQSPDMVWLIKCFDSKTDGRARRVPHSAFTVPGMEGMDERESIEIRALVFHEDDK